MNKKQDILPNDESLEKESPLLHSISKENPFSVPENYFDSLPSEIIEKCKTEVISGRWSVNPISYISYFISGYKWKVLTATGCVAVICFFVLRLNNRPVSYEALAQNIPDSLIVERLDNNIADINIATLEDFQTPENSLSSIKSPSDSANTDQDIIAYLIDNNVTVTDIANEP